jgi:8-oxo-dGTP diphosphatase
MYKNGYVPPILTTDSVVFRLNDSQLEVLLIKRAAEPFKGTLALPGGYIAAGETTMSATHRILQTKAGMTKDTLTYLEQLQTFDTIARDPRGHAVSIAYIGLCRDIEPAATVTTQSPEFYPVNDLPPLAYDHEEIITFARNRLRSRLQETTIALALLPPLFTLTQLQSSYEAVIGHELDKRNFRKKFLSLNVLDETDELLRQGAHRPAKLYRFKQPAVTTLTNDFD